MIMKLNKKGASQIFTGILILVLSVLVMITIIAFVIPFFNNINDTLNYRNNKKNIFLINQELMQLKDLEEDSYAYLNIKTDSEIDFDADTDKVIITQQLKNETKEFKEQIYGNIRITKQNNSLTYTLDLDGIIDLNKSITLTNSQKIKLIVSKAEAMPVLNLESTNQYEAMYPSAEKRNYFNVSDYASNLIVNYDFTKGNSFNQKPEGKQTIVQDILFDRNGANFNGMSSKIQLDKELLLGNSNFAIEFLLDGNYYGYVFNKNGEIGGFSTYIDQNRYINTVAQGIDIPYAPVGIAVDDSYIYFTDGFHRLIKLRKTDYSFIKQIGTTLTYASSGNYEFSTPSQVAIYGDELYVADYGNHAIKVYNKNELSFLRKYQVSRGSEINNLRYPRGVAVDENFVYISDTDNHRVMVRNKSDFSYARHYGGTAGNGQDQLYYPRDIAVDDNYLYIADNYNHRIMIRNKLDLNYVTQLGTTGSCSSAQDRFCYPTGVFVDANYLYIADSSEHRIKKYQKGTWTLVNMRPASGGSSGYDFNRFVTPTSIAVDSEGFVYTTDYSNYRIVKSDTNLNFVSRFPEQQLNNRILNNDNLWSPYGIVYDEGYIYISDASNHRILKKRVDNLETVAMFGNRYGLGGSGTTGVYTPYDLKIDGNYLYIADYWGYRILLLNKSDLSYFSSFGTSNCSASATTSQFCYPRSIAFDQNYIYVTDGRNHRVLKYLKSDFSFVAKTDGNYSAYSCNTTSNLMYYPTGIAVDDEFVYVTQTSCDHGIKVLNKADLSFVTWYGWDYATNTTEAFNTPFFLTIDGNYLYVADCGNHRIKRINTKNLSPAATNDFGSYGYMPAELYYPRGVALSESKLYVTDYLNRRIVVYDRNLIDQNVLINGATYDNNNFSAMDNNQYYQPTALAVDENYLYVADTYNNRLIKQNKETGVAEVVIGRRYYTSALSYPNDFDAPMGIAVDENYVYQTDYYDHVLTKRNKSDFSRVAYLGGSGTGNNNFYYPRGVTLDENYIYIADTGNHRIKIHNKSDLAFVGNIGVPGSSGSGTDKFYNPYDVAVDNNYIYVADYSNNRIKIHNKFPPYGYVAMFGSSGTGDANYFRNPSGIAVDENYIYVSDETNNRVVKYNKQNYGYITKLGGNSYNNDNNSFYLPAKLRVYDNLIYVTDMYNHRIQVLDTNLNFIKSYNGRSFGDNQYLGPASIDVDNSYVWVADNLNNRIVKRNKADFSFVSSLGGPLPGNANDKFNSPYGIASDGTNVFVSDYAYHRLKKLSSTDLSFISSIGGTGSGSGINQFYNPIDITINGNLLYIGDYSNNRIKIHNKNDLSFVSMDYGLENNNYNQVISAVADENYIYVSEANSYIVKKIRKDNYKLVAQTGGYDENYYKGTYYTQTYNQYVFGQPRELAIDANYLYVADNGNHRIMVFHKSDLSYAGKIGRYGQGPMDFANTYGVDVDNDFVYVADYSNNRIVRRQKSDMLTENRGFSSGLILFPNNLSSLYQISENTPTHVVIQRTGNNLCYYINGAKDNCLDISKNPNYFNFDTKTWLLSIGSKDDITNAKGSMKFFRIYDRAFDDTDINNMFNQINLDYNLSLENRALTTGLVAYYKLDENSGTVIDSTGSKNGTAQGNTTPNQPGKIGTAYSFDGSGDYIDCGANDIVGDKDFSFGAWVKINSFNRTQAAISIGSASMDRGAYLGAIALGYDFGNNNNVNYSIGGGLYNYDIATGVNTTNEWVHLFMTYNSTTKDVRIYINGIQNIITTRASVNLNSTYTRIGRLLSDTSYDFNGSIDEVGIWSRVISPDEVLRLYNAGNGLTYPFIN